VKYFNPDDKDMDMTRGPVSQFYASYNAMAKYTQGPDLDAFRA